MREPPKVTMPRSGEQINVVLSRLTREINAVTEWMLDAVTRIETSRSFDAPAHADVQGRDCPACGDGRPCSRMRELTGG